MPDVSQVGASSAVVVVVIIFLRYLREESYKRDKKDAIFAQAIKANTKATQSADQYLRDRNGQDTEIHQKLIKEIQQIPIVLSTEMREVAKHNLDEYRKLHKPRIERQEVKHQTVETEVVQEKK